MKLIYYRLCRTTQLINDYLGWSIAADIIQNLVFISFTIYWGYILLLNRHKTKNFKFSIVGLIVRLLSLRGPSMLHRNCITIGGSPRMFHFMWGQCTFLQKVSLKCKWLFQTFLVRKELRRHFIPNRSNFIYLNKVFLNQIQFSLIMITIKGFVIINRQ